ncbi:Accessory secretory protein Asp1 [Desulfovibrio sp. TomC]|nr:Accessory secretory protein Asp1 [Desulfovibrio sp. TomC]
MDINSLPDDPATLKGLLADMAASQADQQQHIAQLEQRLRLLNLIIYGPKSEKKPRTGQEQQLSLFDEAEQAVEEQKPQTFGEACAPASTRRKRGRRPIPADLPRVEIIHDLPESEKACPCGTELVRIGEEVSEKLDIVPAKIQVIRHIRPKYACRACEGVEADGPTVKTVSMPPQIIPQGIVTPGLLAHVVVAKYADALPLYRQEDQLDISRGTLAGWIIRVAKACNPLIDMIIAEIHSGPIVNMDETTVQVLRELDRANTSKSYMWVARGGTPGKPVVLFRYHPPRAGSVAAEILGDFKGYLQTDGYSSYEALGEREGLRHLGCMAHVRRKFVEVEKTAGKKGKGGTAHAALDLIGKLYDVERQAEKQKLKPEQIATLRAEKSRPILDKLKALLDARVASTPPKSLLGKTIGYAIKQ